MEDQILEYNPKNHAKYSIILLHGLGASGNDLYPLARHIGNGLCRVVCPNAPIMPVTLNGGMQMPAWYDIIGSDLSDRQDEKGVAQSTQFIHEIINSEIEKGFAADHIFLAGFSQGAAMSLHIGLRYPQTVAGIIVLSGYLLFAQQALPMQNKSVPIFQAHGTLDPVVLPEWARTTHNILQENDFNITYCEYNIMHNISQDTIDSINQWILPLISTKE